MSAKSAKAMLTRGATTSVQGEADGPKGRPAGKAPAPPAVPAVAPVDLRGAALRAHAIAEAKHAAATVAEAAAERHRHAHEATRVEAERLRQEHVAAVAAAKQAAEAAHAHADTLQAGQPWDARLFTR